MNVFRYISLLFVRRQLIGWQTPFLRDRRQYRVPLSGREGLPVGHIGGEVSIYELMSLTEGREEREGKSRILRYFGQGVLRSYQYPRASQLGTFPEVSCLTGQAVDMLVGMDVGYVKWESPSSFLLEKHRESPSCFGYL